MSKKLKDQLTSGTATSGTKHSYLPDHQVAPRDVSYREYYLRWGYLPPGFSIEVNGETIHGGCAKWQAYAKSRGYPQEPAPNATGQEKYAYQRFMDKTFRPWMHGDDPISHAKAPRSETDLYHGDWSAADYQAREQRTWKKAKPETVASANEWLRNAGVENLSHDHPLRRKALADWGKWFQRQPNPNIAPNDPNLQPPPKGWKRPNA